MNGRCCSLWGRVSGSGEAWASRGWRTPWRATGRAAVVATLAAAAACGGSPTQPSTGAGQAGGGGGALRVSAGPHLLIVTASSVAGGDCVFAAAGVTSVGVTSRVEVRSEGSGWVARPATGEGGDFVLRFAPGGAAAPGAIGLSGSASGAVADFGLSLSGPTGVRLGFDGVAVVGGSQLPSAAALTGEARGGSRFTDRAGTVATCSRVTWSLAPA